MKRNKGKKKTRAQIKMNKIRKTCVRKTIARKTKIVGVKPEYDDELKKLIEEDEGRINKIPTMKVSKFRVNKPNRPCKGVIDILD